MQTPFLAALCVIALSGAGFAAGEPKVIKTVTVYQTSSRYGGWPANHGIWSWDNEILVGFSAAYFKWLGPDQHPYDRDKPEEPYLGRSLDGGETWSIEPAPSLVPPEGMYTASRPGGKAADLAEPIDFTVPGLCMTFRMTQGQKGRSWFFILTTAGNRGRVPSTFRY